LKERRYGPVFALARGCLRHGGFDRPRDAVGADGYSATHHQRVQWLILIQRFLWRQFNVGRLREFRRESHRTTADALNADRFTSAILHLIVGLQPVGQQRDQRWLVGQRG
jgi:hypothetical protein